MEFSLYIGSTKAKHAIDYTLSKNACTTFKSQKEIKFEQNTKKYKKSHKGVKTKSFPNYIRESNQHKIGSKVQQVNKAKANEHKNN
jgi:hypothetical protein